MESMRDDTPDSELVDFRRDGSSVQHFAAVGDVVSGLVLALALLVGCSGVERGDEVLPPPCERLRDHLVDIRLSAIRRGPKDLPSQRDALEQALGNDFVTSCERNMTAPQLGCALAARDLRL